MDEDGEIDGTFNTNFLKLSPHEMNRYLGIVKEILLSKTNEELREIQLEKIEIPGLEQRILEALLQQELKEDALLETVYGKLSEHFCKRKPFGIFVFYGAYDIPRKGTDKIEQWESEEVYRYLVGVVCPLEKEYEPGEPEWGFLWPAFKDRGGDLEHIAVYCGTK